MKRLIGLIAAAAFLYGCASSRPVYNAQQFATESYQQNVANAIEYADNFVDFDQKNIPKAELGPEDFSILLKADIAFNQGEYAAAGNNYYYLANKYPDPRLIYKGIVCFEHTSIAPEQYAKLNELIRQLLSVAPDSNLAKLFGIRLAVEKGDLSTAKSDLKGIIKSDPSKARAILLFLATIIGNDIDKGRQGSLNEFAAYVADKYAVYPEASLVAVTSYSVSSNQPQLLDELDQINLAFPNWEIPVYWSAGILAKNEDLELLRVMLQHEIQRTAQPSATLQNLYVASLIRSDRLQDAESYIQQALLVKPQEANLVVDKAIVNYKLGNNPTAISYLLQAKLLKYDLGGAIDLALASLYDYSGNNESAIQYYQNVIKQSPVLSPAANMGILRAYLDDKNPIAADAFIDILAKNAKLSAYDAAVLKISLFAGLGQNELAYQVAKQKIELYSYDKTFVYLYASLSGITKRTTQAIKWYHKYIAMNPNDPSGYNDLAFILVDNTPHYLQAKSLAEKAYQMAPNDPAILDTVGWTYYKLGQYDKAEELVGRAYHLTQDRDTAMHLKTIYQTVHKPELAAKVIILTPQIEQIHFEQNILNQAMLILMYYQYGLDLSR